MFDIVYKKRQTFLKDNTESDFLTERMSLVALRNVRSSLVPSVSPQRSHPPGGGLRPLSVLAHGLNTSLRHKSASKQQGTHREDVARIFCKGPRVGDVSHLCLRGFKSSHDSNALSAKSQSNINEISLYSHTDNIT